MLVFRKEILAMISNELNKRLVNYGQAVTRIEELEKSNRHLRIRLHTMEQNLQRICKDVGYLQERTKPVNDLPITSDQRIAELREELNKHKHEVECTKTKLRLLGVRDV